MVSQTLSIKWFIEDEEQESRSKVTKGLFYTSHFFMCGVLWRYSKLLFLPMGSAIPLGKLPYLVIFTDLCRLICHFHTVNDPQTQCVHLRVFLSVLFLREIIFGESEVLRLPFCNFRGSEFCYFGQFHPSKTAKIQNS